MSGDEKDRRQRLGQARAVALFRYSLIQEVISPHLTAAQRGRRVRELAAAAHPGPDGQDIRVSYQSLNRWKRAYLDGGFEALVPAPRQAAPRTPAEVLDLAAALKRENPERTAAQDIQFGAAINHGMPITASGHNGGDVRAFAFLG